MTSQERRDRLVAKIRDHLRLHCGEVLRMDLDEARFVADFILERDKSRCQHFRKVINNIGEAIDHVLDPSSVANIENLLPCCISRLKSAKKSLSTLDSRDGA